MTGLLAVLAVTLLTVWAALAWRTARLPRRDWQADRRVDRYHRARDRSLEVPRASRTLDDRYVQ